MAAASANSTHLEYSEHITEKYFRKILENTFPLDIIIIEQQKTSNAELANALDNSSKHNTGNNGRPDFIITCASCKVIFLVECKKDKQHHATKDYSNPAKCACDGAIWYGKLAAPLMPEYRVYGIGVSGPFPDMEIPYDSKTYNLQINSFSINTDGTYGQLLESGLLPFDKYITCSLVEKKSQTRELIGKIHNFIRDNFNMTELQKPLAISICLLGNLWKIDTAEEVISKCLNDFNIRIEELKGSKFLSSESKKEWKDMSAFNYVKNEIKHCPSDMQDFYIEFIRYSGGDGKNLGIVMTPSHIAELMATLADINTSCGVIDICAGTGSFLWQALNKGAKCIYGIEFNSLMFNLLNINAILRKVDTTTLYNTDALTVKIDGTFSRGLLNPPYSQKGYSELKFVNFLLDMIESKGRVVAIIPASTMMIMTDERNNLIQKHNLLAVITMPPQIFYPTAIGTVIIILEAKTPYAKKTWLCNFADDGFVLEKHLGRVEYKWKEKRLELLNRFRREETVEGYSTITELTTDAREWVFAAFNTSLKPVNLIEFKKAKITYEAAKKLAALESANIGSGQDDEKVEYKKYLITDLFDIVTPQKITIKHASKNPGTIPLISSTEYNNGISEFSSCVTYDSGDKLFLSLATGGSVGAAFIQKGKIGTANHVVLLIPKIVMNENLLLYISKALKEASKNYGFNREWGISRLKESQILLPKNLDIIETL